MKRTEFLVLLFAVCCESKLKLVPQAIFQLVQSHYGEGAVQIEVIYNSDQLKFLDKTLKLLGEVKQIKVTRVVTEREINNFIYLFYDQMSFRIYNNEAIFLFDTWDKFQELFQRIYDRPAELREISVLVHCEDAKKRDLQAVINEDTFGTFLIEENNEIALNTMTMYTEQKCGVPQLLEINRFSPSKIKWETQQCFNTEFKTFYGCNISFDLMEDNLPFSNYDHNSVFSMNNAEGAVYQMMVELTKTLNFTLCKSDCDSLLLFWPMGQMLAKSEQFALSDPIISSSDVFIVPPGEPYTSWEKLFLPFDDATWMWLGITFAIAFLVIIFIKLTRSTSMYEFVIGSNVTTPALNVIGIFMGIGQIFLPQRNISRFLFMVFVLFCLIMRTAYQGKYFEFITTDVRRSPVKEIEEFEEKKFTLFVDSFNLGYDVTRIDALKR